MKKAFNVVSKIMLIIAFTIFLVSVIIPGIIYEAGEIAFLTLLMANVGLVVCATVGVMLVLFKSKETAKLVGNGMMIAAFTIGAAIGFMSMDSSTSAILMIVAAGFLVLYYIFLLIVKILSRGAVENDNPVNDSRIAKVREWKQILDEGIITAEEFEEKRVQILGLDKNKEKKTDK